MIAECDRKLARQEPSIEAELTEAVKQLGDLAARLAVRDPAKRSKAYDALGLHLLWVPGTDAI
jgi:hypothetical protein